MSRSRQRTPIEPSTYHEERIEDDRPPTPPAQRAKIKYQTHQIDQLVSEKHALARKHTADLARMEQTITSLKTKLSDSEKWKRKAESREVELGQLKAEGEGMRAELNLFSEVAQRKALLAVANEQMALVEMEQRLLQAETARVMRDHKISLFKAREADMEAELAEKDQQLADLDAKLEEANTSLEHQRAAQIKSDKLNSSTASEELASAQKKVVTLESKVETLENKVKSSKEREKELKAELEAALGDAKGDSDKEKRELQKALRDTKSTLETKTEELSDLQEELNSLKETSKEREKALKAKVKEATAERDRLVGVEEELEGLRAARASSAITDKPKAPKVKRPKDESDEETEVAQKKAKRESPRKKVTAESEELDAPYRPDKAVVKPKIKAPLRETSQQPKPNVLVLDKVEEKEPEKKKKRKLLGNTTAFTWDPIMNSADGVIPAFLSPKVSKGAGTIPRAGFGKSIVSSRNLGRLQ